ncbi:MAG: heavy-metal-associated domain-containing protein [Ginsengibacter sp.]
MKSIKFLGLIFISLIAFQFSNAQTISDSVMVNGNCGSCKKTIEKNALAAGAETAFWNKTTKFLTVSYDPAKSNSSKIQQSVANAGYDTQDFKANDKAYKGLDECCQYDRSKDLKVARKN